MPRPIEMHDSIWIEDLTMMAVRDLIKAGKTTAAILASGIEETGPLPDERANTITCSVWIEDPTMYGGA
jgi:hypothetical protein